MAFGSSTPAQTVKLIAAKRNLDVYKKDILVLSTEMKRSTVYYRDTDEPLLDRSNTDESEPVFPARDKPETGVYVRQLEAGNDDLLHSAIATYLNEIAEVPLLTAAEEVELAEHAECLGGVELVAQLLGQCERLLERRA